jgi:very-short-patch-repair endonuclease
VARMGRGVSIKILYNPKLKELARTLRNNSTLSEVLLWNHLKGRQMKGYDFHRQKPIDNYIVDFFCPKLRLIIEIDGESHVFKGEQDKKRESRIESLGFHILRFGDLDVKKNIEGVLVAIERWINEYEHTRLTHP